MADFAVRVVRIDAPVEHHPNADRLSLVRIGGYVLVTRKSENGEHAYAMGDHVAYVPEGAVLPEALLRELGFWKDIPDFPGGPHGMLAGPRGDRVQALRLRNILSQGVIYPVIRAGDTSDLFLDIPRFSGDDRNGHERVAVQVGDDLAELLGIVKYSPPIPVELDGEVLDLWGVVSKFEVNSIESMPDLFEMGDWVEATEKAHGINMQFGLVPGLNNPDCFGGGSIYLCGKGLGNKGLAFKDVPANDDNHYVGALRALLSEGLGDRLRAVSNEYQGASVKVIGELFGAGVAGFKYGSDRPTFRMFDVLVNNEFQRPAVTAEIARQLKLETLPMLYEGPYDPAVLAAVRDGKTTIGGTDIREGVVVRATNGERHPIHGRKVAKMVSERYLTRSGAGDELS